MRTDSREGRSVDLPNTSPRSLLLCLLYSVAVALWHLCFVTLPAALSVLFLFSAKTNAFHYDPIHTGLAIFVESARD